MELNICCGSSSISPMCLFSLFFLIFSSVSASPTYLSDSIFGDGASIGRNLLQAKTPCPVNFEFSNYTIITSQCHGPTYPPKICCGAFKIFACPYADDLNDLRNDCASTMFSYINLYGKYPPGLFANLCRDGKQGLECPASQSENANASFILKYPKPLLLLATCLLVLLLSLF